MITDFKVPEEALEILREPQGKLISKAELQKLKGTIVSVGDETTLSLIEAGINPKLSIVDFKIKRKPIDEEKKLKLKNWAVKILKAKNPKGFISLDSWKKIKESIQLENALLIVEGEEDLLALACFFLFPEGTKILYGQPDKGLVLMDVNNKKKQDYANLLISASARIFLGTIRGKTIVLHHSDPDGMCSAAIFIKYLKSKGIPVVPIFTVDPTIHENLKREIEKEKAKNLIILDLGGEASEKISKLSIKMKILVVDHHHLYKTNFGNALVLNPHLFKVPENLVPPTSMLAYNICNVGDWIAAIGILGDKGDFSCKELLESVKKKYPDVDFNYLLELFNSAGSVGESDTAVKILLNSKNPKDTIIPKLIIYRQKIEEEVQKILKAHKEKARLINTDVLFYEISSNYDIRGTIANKLQVLYPNKIIIVGEIEGDMFSMSLRTNRNDVDFPSIIKKSINGLKDSQGGGHSKASGCKVLLKDKEIFLNRFVNLLKNS